MAGPRAHRFKTLLWFVLGTVVALAWGELFTRVLLPQSRDTVLDILVADPDVGYIYEPGAVMDERGRDYDVPFVINSLGLREREIGPKGEDVYRIQLVGNSFSVSHGIAAEASLGRVLERELAAAGAPRPVEVLNTSNAGYNSLNYRMAFRRWAPVLRPDALVVGFVQAREHKCDDESTRYIIRDGLLQGRYLAGETPAPPKRSPLTGVRKFLARNSDLYVLLRNYLYYNEKIDKLLRRGASGGGARNELKPYLSPTPRLVAEGWERAFDQLGKLRDEARAAGVELIVLSIPERSEVDAAYAAGLAAQAGLEPEAVDRGLPSARLRDFCAAADIPLLECGPAVTRAHGAEPAFFQYDNHWNPRGVEAGARAAAEQWRALGLPPFASSSATPSP